MAVGTVKWSMRGKGFGFIQPTDAGTDVFIYIGAAKRDGMRDLNAGENISYDVIAETSTRKSSTDNLKPT